MPLGYRTPVSPCSAIGTQAEAADELRRRGYPSLVVACRATGRIGCGFPGFRGMVGVSAAKNAPRLTTKHETTTFHHSPARLALKLPPSLPPYLSVATPGSRLCSKAVKLRPGAAAFATVARRGADLTGVLVNSSLRAEGQRSLMQVCSAMCCVVLTQEGALLRRRFGAGLSFFEDAVGRS